LKNEIKIVLFTMRTSTNGSSRIHAFNFRHIFESYGAKVKINPPFPSFMDRIEIYLYSLSKISKILNKILRRIFHFFTWRILMPAVRILQVFDIFFYNVIIIQKGCTELFESLFFERIIVILTRITQKTFIYHFDDIIASKEMEAVTKYLIKEADAVITVNKILLRYGTEMNKNIFLIPENILNNEIKRIDNLSNNLHSPIEIGWLGSGGEYKYNELENIQEAFSRLVGEFNLKLKIVSNVRFSFKKNIDLIVENCEWTFERDFMFYCDIGINPLPYDLAREGKGSFKLLKYMAHGIPAVTSWTCDEFNRNEETCLVASGVDEWYNQIKRFIIDEMLRKKIVVNGINEAHKYSTMTLGKKYFEIINRTYNPSH
jgi:glycosyltransferase involved in cell wall biosynthesis